MSKDEAIAEAGRVWRDTIADVSALKKQIRAGLDTETTARIKDDIKARRGVAAHAIHRALGSGATEIEVRQVTNANRWGFEWYVKLGSQIARDAAKRPLGPPDTSQYVDSCEERNALPTPDGVVATAERLIEQEHQKQKGEPRVVGIQAHTCDVIPQDRFYRGPELRTWQSGALKAWEANERRGVIEAITGTGKSLVGVNAIRDVIALGGKALVIVPTLALLDQWHNLLRENLAQVRVGVLTAGHHDSFQEVDILVSTVQTACKKRPLPQSLGLLVADETHRYGSNEYSKALHPTYGWRLGLTATLERADDGVDRILVPYFGNTVYQYGYENALEDQVVAPFHLAMVGVEFSRNEEKRYREASDKCSDSRRDLQHNYGYPNDWADFFSRVQSTLKDEAYDEKFWLCSMYIHAFSQRRTIMAEARAKESLIEHIAPSFGSNTGTLIFTETKHSAARLAYTVNKHTRAWPLTSDSKPEERRRMLSRFKSGQLGVLCTPRILDEGIDVPDAQLAVIVASSSSRRQMIQRMGRVIRLKRDGGAAYILIAFVKGTAEDPNCGGHEAFLEEVWPHAATTTVFDGSSINAVVNWLQERPAAVA